jgi:tRNA (guanosine-2'-O-)-methyltransferase
MTTDELIYHFEQFVLERRKSLIDSLIQYRTRYITVVLEDIYQSQNASAVLRTCDCFGIQDVHIIENKNKFNINPDVTLGSNKWLTLTKYTKKEKNSLSSIKSLKDKGYRIAATTPHTNDTNLEDYDLSKGKTALVFGTELRGLSDDIINNADEYIKIPMHGFTESFNISVSAAIILHHLTYHLRKSNINWQLSEDEKKEVKLEWLKKSVKKSQMLEKELLKKSLSNNHLKNSH